MKSSNNDPADNTVGVENSETEKRFDLTTLPTETSAQKLIRRIDLPVQLTRIAILAFILWIWQSRKIFSGIKVFGVEILPEIIPLFQGVPTEAWDYVTQVWDDSLFWQDFWVTLQEALLGFLYGSLSGFIVGMLLGLSLIHISEPTRPERIGDGGVRV